MQPLRFVSPIMGDVLLAGPDGAPSDGRLMARVAVSAREGAQIRVNGLPAERSDAEAEYVALVPLDGYRNRIEASDLTTGERKAITVLWLRGAEAGYRFTVDDCIRCFEDIHNNRQAYDSIFDNPFLAIFKRAHDEYGSMVHINAFYESVDGRFNLSMMTDRFRNEFTANADWLSITFHARSEFPDAPYKNADYQKVYDDCVQCTREIERFAGRAALRDTTTLHWGAANVGGVRALRAFGFKALCGYLCFDCDGKPLVSYHLSPDQVSHAELREGLYDADEDVLFPKLDLVLNAPDLPAERVAQRLDELHALRHQGALIQMVIHEQYFYPDYPNYEHDYAQRIFNMAQWMRDHGYRCISLSNVIREGWWAR